MEEHYRIRISIRVLLLTIINDRNTVPDVKCNNKDHVRAYPSDIKLNTIALLQMGNEPHSSRYTEYRNLLETLRINRNVIPTRNILILDEVPE